MPRNGAAAAIGFDLARLNADQIGNMSLSTSAVASRYLNYAVIVGETSAKQSFKLLVHSQPNNRLQLSYLNVGFLERYGTAKMRLLWRV